ncbi:response regulator [Belnapia sp. T18]|uniref:histidine kinase n=1 Tax=Belnapia arida TaxID=2804533 RepID=A0ABS1UDC6_9PROT|nr:ATP-binding protein [Belnapia arida]MBL6082692.1 response regulator [Belnapia arida]
MAADADIQAERVTVMMRQTPLAAIVTAANASLMAAVLAASTNESQVLLWLGAAITVAVLRLALWNWHQKSVVSGGGARTRYWAALGTCGAAAAGAVWGGGAAWLWPQSESHQLLWVFLIGGMCTGAAAIHNTYLPSALAFILLAGSPVAARYASSASPSALAAAGMVLVYLGAMVVLSWRASNQFAENIRLRMNFERQAKQLDAANEQLRHEIAQHRATEAILRQAQRMEALGQLTGGIAHDFNNLLTIVLGNLALLRHEMPADARAAMRYANNALLGAQRGAALTQRLLTFGRGQTLRPEAIDLAALVSGMSALLHNAVGPGVEVVTRVPSYLPPVYVDANQLELALLNLAVNARDAMPSGGVITVTASEQTTDVASTDACVTSSKYVVLSVTDTGEGMDEATLAKATEPFFTTKEVGKGTGLGLSMAHGFAAQSGGKLILHSAKGAGTTVEFWLPRMAPQAGEATGKCSAPDGFLQGATVEQKPLTVLLVDDDDLVLSSTAAMLEHLGHGVIEAGSGDEALAAISGATAVDLVITDHGMPGMTGIQLAQAIHKMHPKMPVILYTGYHEDEAPVGVFLLPKPFGQQELVQAIELCMATKAAT